MKLIKGGGDMSLGGGNKIQKRVVKKTKLCCNVKKKW